MSEKTTITVNGIEFPSEPALSFAVDDAMEAFDTDTLWELVNRAAAFTEYIYQIKISQRQKIKTANELGNFILQNRKRLRSTSNKGE